MKTIRRKPLQEKNKKDMVYFYYMYIYNYLCDLVKGGHHSFHTPGHKGKGEDFLSREFSLSRDIPDDQAEIPLYIEKSQKKTASLFGVDLAYYLVGGSSAGVKTMFLYYFCPGDKVLIARNLHKSAVAGMIYSGVNPVYLPVEFHRGQADWDEDIPLNISPWVIEKGIRENPECKGVFITTPSCYGINCDIGKIYSICKRYKKVLLVDCAWGALLNFCPELAPFPLGNMTVCSIHKTLPSLSGTALLLVKNRDEVDKERLEEVIGMIETTSPNMIFYSSIEWGIKKILKERDGIEKGSRVGGERVGEEQDGVGERDRIGEEQDGIGGGRVGVGERILNYNKYVKDMIKEPGFSCMGIPSVPQRGFSSLPYLIRIFTHPRKTGISGYEVRDYLNSGFKVYTEMADRISFTLLLTGWEEDEDIKRLEEGFRGLAKEVRERIKSLDGQGENHAGKGEEIKELGNGFEGERKLDKVFAIPPFPSGIPQMLVPPRIAFFSACRWVEIEKGEGMISSGMVTPYPPGIPLLVPGEAVSMEVMDYILKIFEKGGLIKGLKEAEGKLFMRVMA